MSTTDNRKNNKIESLQSFLPRETARIRAALEGKTGTDFLRQAEEFDRQRSAFIQKRRQVPLGSESFLAVLRRWNSYTPSLPRDDAFNEVKSQYSVGGGYFLFLQSDEYSLMPGYGLVIDPGYNFIHNFGATGFALDDIDGILLTHAHNDHTNDFESILSLLYQRNHKYSNRKAPKRVDLFLNVGSFKKFSNYLDLSRDAPDRHIGHVIVMSPGQVHSIPSRPDLDCTLYTLRTNHHELVTAEYSLGLCVRIAGRIVLFSGDTGWTFETFALNEDFLRAHGVYTREQAENHNVDLLVAHIGTITRTEMTISEETPIEKAFYDKHLGLMGVLAIAEQWKPLACVISEFGEELTSLRVPIVEEIERSLHSVQAGLRCIPGDVGLLVFLDSRRSLCYYSGKLVSLESIQFSEAQDKGGTIIKYYSAQSVVGLNDETRKQLQDTKSMANGLDLYKTFYAKELLYGKPVDEDSLHAQELPNGQPVDKDSLIAAFSDKPYDGDDYSGHDYYDHAYNNLLVLSTVVAQSEEFLDVLKVNPMYVSMNTWLSP